MCGRYTLLPNANALIEYFQLPREIFALLEPRYNIAPTQNVLVIREKDAQHHAEQMLWGLIPSWSPEPKPNASLINARGETVAQKSSFRTAFKRRRCIIPASGFYEWKTTGKTKQPFYIRPATELLFAFAGVWEEWEGPGSCSIITTEANSLMEPFHDRMPVILEKKDFECWLQLNEDTKAVKPLLKPFDPAAMMASPVSNFVSSARNQGPKCLEPAEVTQQEQTLFD